MTESSGDPIHRSAREAMGTVFEVMIAGQEADYAAQASEAAFREVERLEALFSRFNATSEVGQINRLRSDESLRISPEAFECLQAAEKVRRETSGAFDPNFRRSAGYSDRPAFDLTADESGFRVRFHADPFRRLPVGLDLDLGAIGKGYALDRAASLLADWGVERFLIHGGTSTALAAGSAPGISPGETGWPVGVGGTWELTEIPKRVLLRNRALSGSGSEVKGRHILDPRTGRQAEGHHAAWVSHPSAAVADALSTAFMAMSHNEVRRYCRDHPDVWALLITPKRKGRIFNPGIIPA
ncbi:MAG: FAD:protein FMN transferase [Candidatus Aminicenantes bacterium]|nr:FAD:protein FMN transferase [Candidatus Aminicenantes bacterium]